MKNVVINFLMNIVKKDTKYSEERYAEIRYGLEGFYLTFSKLLLITILSILLNLFKPFIIFTLIYYPLRAFSFGWHANKSWQCWVISPLAFLLLPYLSITVTIPFQIKYLIIILIIIIIGLYAPADTKKRPLVNPKRRFLYKCITLIITLIYSYFILINDNYYMLFALIYQCLLINPLTYILSNQTFDNYKNYSYN